MKVGDTLPEFELFSDKNELFKSASLKGRPAVIYFYPKDETAGCTAQACSFRDHFEDFSAAGVEVIGISSDSVESHVNFKQYHRLPFMLLADTKNAVRKMFGVKGNLLGLIPGRETFVFNAQGKLVSRFESQINVTKHVSEALKALGI